MEQENDSKIPLLEDIETAVPTDIYPVKPVKQDKQCKWKKCGKKCNKKKAKFILKKILKVTLLVFLAFSLFATIKGIQFYRFFSKEIKNWTVTEPHPLPIIDVPEEELEMIKSRAKLFYDTVQAGKLPSDFIIAATDLNGFAASSDFLRGNAFAQIAENEVKIDVSLPTHHLPGGKGRYFVGTETITWDPETSIINLKMEPLDENIETIFDIQLKLSKLEDGQTWNLEVVSGKALHWTVPQDFIDEHVNLLEDLFHCDCHEEECMRTRNFIESLTGIELEKDQVVIHAGAYDSYEMAEPGHRALRHGHHHCHGDHDRKQKHHHGKHWKKRAVRKLLAY